VDHAFVHEYVVLPAAGRTEVGQIGKRGRSRPTRVCALRSYRRHASATHPEPGPESAHDPRRPNCSNPPSRVSTAIIPASHLEARPVYRESWPPHGHSPQTTCLARCRRSSTVSTASTMSTAR
jgi:hypothetical protein